MTEHVEQSISQGWSRNCRDYYDLCKPKVVGLIVFTAIVGMFLSTPGLPPIMAVLFGTLNVAGGFVVTDRMLEMFKKKKKVKS